MNNNTRNGRKCVIGAYLGRVAHGDALGVDLGEVLAALVREVRDRGIAALYGRIGVPRMRGGLHVGDWCRRVRETTRAGYENRRKGCERSRFVLGQSAERYPGTPEGKLKPKPFPKADFHPKRFVPKFFPTQKTPPPLEIFRATLEPRVGAVPPRGETMTDNVKSDSKGRLTGATPGGNYVKKTLPDGTITFTPTEAEVTPDKGSTHLIYSTNLKNGNPRITIEMPNLKDQRQVARVIQAVSQELPLDEVWMEGTGVKAVAYETLRKRLVTGKMVQFYPSAKGFTEFRD